MEAGLEMEAAMEEASKLDVPIIYGDDSQEPTVQRVTQSVRQVPFFWLTDI